MKRFSDAIRAEPLCLKLEDAAAMLAMSTQTFERCREADWIKPAINRHKFVRYDVADVRRLYERIKREGLPRCGVRH